MQRRTGVLAKCLLIFSLIYGPGLIAQECHPVTGAWKMNPSKSFFAGTRSADGQAEAETLRMTQTPGKILQVWNYQGSKINGEVSYEFTTDGKDNKITARGVGNRLPQFVRAEWQNCTLIYWEKTVVFGMMEFETKNTVVLSAGGKELTILQESHTVLGDTERRLAFDLE